MFVFEPPIRIEETQRVLRRAIAQPEGSFPMTGGTTASERYLSNLCEKSFLSLWSWPNVFRDQRSGDGSTGKEVCDLLVVFENHILVFSDKYCQFPSSGNIELDWCRWFKRAVWKSAQQIWGAERWIKEQPDRLFLDPDCTKPFPIPLPPLSSARIHRIVVAHGAGSACKKLLGGTGSLMVVPQIIGRSHFDSSTTHASPFAVGRLSADKGFIHVVDDFTLDTLLSTLDTTSDFIRYLECKEKFVKSGKLISAAGEEELLAYYLQHINQEGYHDFTFNQKFDGVTLDEGFWEKFQNHPDRKAQIFENQISYAWDRLIELFTTHTLEGNTYFSTHDSLADHERALRILASEDRLHRRMHAKALLGVLKRGQEIDRFARVVKLDEREGRYYVFLSLVCPSQITYEEYREVRRGILEAYCLVTRLRFPDASDIVGIACEPMGSGGGSEDLAYFDGRLWNEDMALEAARLSSELKIMEKPEPYHIHTEEYPREQLREAAKGRNRNARCTCGSGKKHKKCCGANR